jgi:hypothetical protein
MLAPHLKRMGDKAKPSARRNTGGFADRSTPNLSGSEASQPGVSIRPGMTALTVIPYSPNSSAADFIKPILEAE